LGDIFRSSHAVGGASPPSVKARAIAEPMPTDAASTMTRPSVEIEFHEVLLKRRAMLASARDRQLARTAGYCRSVRKFAHPWCEFEPEALLLLLSLLRHQREASQTHVAVPGPNR
jgi:hypothetical protein